MSDAVDVIPPRRRRAEAALLLAWGVMGTVAALLAVLLGSACATEPLRLVGTGPTRLWEDHELEAPAAPSAPISRDEAAGIALAHDSAHGCELTARALRQRDRERSRAVMEQCWQRPDFTDLEILLAPPWLDELRAHPDAARLIAQVIAARGGDVEHDLRLVRRARLPLSSLRGALAEPGSFRGRYVLMLGTPQENRDGRATGSVELAETRIMAESEWVSEGAHSASLLVRSDEDAQGGAAASQRRETLRHREGRRVEVLHNVSVETGRVVMAELGDDPFLEAGTDYVLLLRFDGVREAVSGSVVEEVPVATVVASFEPSSGLFARLGR